MSLLIFKLLACLEIDAEDEKIKTATVDVHYVDIGCM